LAYSGREGKFIRECTSYLVKIRYVYIINKVLIYMIMSHSFGCRKARKIAIEIKKRTVIIIQSTTVRSGLLIERGGLDHDQSFPWSRLLIISRPVIRVVAQSVGKSRVLVKVSAYPKPSIGGIQPRAYSSAKHDASILYCLTSPRCR